MVTVTRQGVPIPRVIATFLRDVDGSILGGGNRVAGFVFVCGCLRVLGGGVEWPMRLVDSDCSVAVPVCSPPVAASSRQTNGYLTPLPIVLASPGRRCSQTWHLTGTHLRGPSQLH